MLKILSESDNVSVHVKSFNEFTGRGPISIAPYVYKKREYAKYLENLAKEYGFDKLKIKDDQYSEKILNKLGKIIEFTKNKRIHTPVTSFNPNTNIGDFKALEYAKERVIQGEKPPEYKPIHILSFDEFYRDKLFWSKAWGSETSLAKEYYGDYLKEEAKKHGFNFNINISKHFLNSQGTLNKQSLNHVVTDLENLINTNSETLYSNSKGVILDGNIDNIKNLNIKSFATFIKDAGYKNNDNTKAIYKRYLIKTLEENGLTPNLDLINRSINAYNLDNIVKSINNAKEALIPKENSNEVNVNTSNVKPNNPTNTNSSNISDTNSRSNNQTTSNIISANASSSRLNKQPIDNTINSSDSNIESKPSNPTNTNIGNLLKDYYENKNKKQGVETNIQPNQKQGKVVDIPKPNQKGESGSGGGNPGTGNPPEKGWFSFGNDGENKLNPMNWGAGNKVLGAALLAAGAYKLFKMYKKYKQSNKSDKQFLQDHPEANQYIKK